MRRMFALKVASLLTVLAALSVAAFSPTAYAAAPGPNGNPSSTGNSNGNWHYTGPSAQWLALKNAYRIRSGVWRGEPKGSGSHPYVATVSPDT